MNLTMPVARRPFTVVLSLAVCLGLVTSGVCAQGNATFQGLNSLPGWSAANQATAMSGDGSVIVGSRLNAAGDAQEAFRWSLSSGTISLGGLPNPFGLIQSIARGVSADGNTVVGSAAGEFGIPEAFRWTSVTGMVALTPCCEPYLDSAVGVSGDGSGIAINGWDDEVDSTEMHVRRWHNDEVSDLGTCGGPFTSASVPATISADGSAVVGWCYCKCTSIIHAFRWTSAGGMVALGALPGAQWSSAQDVSGNGQVVVGVSGTQEPETQHAWRWTAQTGMVALVEPAGATYSYAALVSGDGRVILGFADGAEWPPEAPTFIWDEVNGMRNLQQLLNEYGLTQVDDWSNLGANDISADGRIILGYGINPLGQWEGWMVTLPADIDGDGLLDSWETMGQGMDIDSDGVIDLDLYAMGARPDHKDLFVEIDCMSGLEPTSLVPVVTAFANAPVSNPDNTTGINLHLQIDDATLPVSGGWTSESTFDHVDSLKSIFFGTAAERGHSNSINILAAKRKACRYCIYAATSDGYAAGVARAIHANDFVMFQLTVLNTLAVHGALHERAVFMHELGHALGLMHGGGDEIFNKPNYISVMNYLVNHPFDTEGWALDFSRGAMLPIIENNIDEAHFLIDPTGHNNGRLTFRPNASALCPAPQCDPIPATSVFLLGYSVGSPPKDLNGDRQITTGICMDLNYHGVDAPVLHQGTTPTPCQIMNDHNDWAALQYALVDEGTPLAGGGPPTNPPVELTIAEIQALEAFLPGPPCLPDITENGTVTVSDLLALIALWGPCTPPPSICTADIAPLPGDGQVNVSDLLALIAAWGPCR